MMHLPRVIAVALGMRQVGSLLPVSYCSPQCPNCKADVGAFDTSVSCTPNSSFIANCGACQGCVLLYNIQNGENPLSNQIEVALMNILNLCENTTVSTDIQALQSQASRISAWGENIATTTADGASSSLTITPTPTTTKGDWDAMASGNPSWTTILSTATWASKYSARKSAESVAATAAAASSLSSLAAARANETASYASPTTTPLSTSTPTPNAPLSQSWVAGPVMGSVLGMSTVFIVIFFTRRKQRRDIVIDPVPKPFHDTPTTPTTRSSSAAGDVPQLHGECVEVKELESTEVHELPALEPVGTELNTPMEARPRIRLGGESIGGDDDREEEEQWAMQSPLPLSPLPRLFAMSELRDERMGRSESLRHETYYHP